MDLQSLINSKNYTNKLLYSTIAEEFSPLKEYVPGDFVIYLGHLYRCKENFGPAN